MGRGREFVPAAELLSGCAQKVTKDALWHTRRGTRCALYQRAAQTATASQKMDADLSRSTAAGLA